MRALVTGACGGIGAATLERFKSGGWEVIGVDRRQAGRSADHILADVSLAEDVARVFSQLNGLDALINNAAIQLNKLLVATEEHEWDEVMHSNVRSVYLCSRAAHRLLAASSGAIVNVASVHSLVTSPGMPAYVASKGAVTALTRAMALEMAPEVRVNAVLPGAVDTPMLRKGMERGAGRAQSVEEMAARHPLGRIGKPEEVAEAIFFLASEGSAFITGQTLIVDGGAAARLSTE